jgi:hypothetical protein
MKTNPQLKAVILQVVDNQLRANDPPEIRSTLERLIKEGYSKEQAKELIGCAVTSEIFDILKNKKEFNLERYRAVLAKLPQMPWD